MTKFIINLGKTTGIFFLLVLTAIYYITTRIILPLALFMLIVYAIIYTPLYYALWALGLIIVLILVLTAAALTWEK